MRAMAMFEGDVHQGRRPLVRPGQQPGGRVLAARQVGHAVAIEKIGDELAVLGGDQLLQLGEGPAARLDPDVPGRHEHVDPERAATDLLLDPRQLEIEPFRRQAHRSQHAEPAGPADRGHDVAAVAEGEDRELDPEAVAQRGVHAASPYRRAVTGGLASSSATSFFRATAR